MKQESQHTRPLDLITMDWLKSRYFSNPDQRINLKKGQAIMHQGELNQRIYYVESGRLTGYFKPDIGDKFEIFSTGPQMIVGIYSFFSPDGCSYTTVMAQENTTVSYLHRSQVLSDESENSLFSQHMLPIIVKEIYLRQMMVVKSAKEKESAMKKLHQSEKMATLGQMAAGLAHELNNAIGIIYTQSNWLTERLNKLFNKGDSDGMYKFFQKGLEKGQSLTSSQIRKRKYELIDIFKIKNKVAKKLAKINLNNQELKLILENDHKDIVDQIDANWETGLALHDINIASEHTKHVVESIRDLGAQSNSKMTECDLKLTVNKSLVLLHNLAKKAAITIEIEDNLSLIAREGDLIQVWLNIIKNALESVLSANIDKPKISIKSKTCKKSISIQIEDNGPGIPENIQEKIFQPNVTTKVHGLSFGLGLGLSIVQKIVNGYGGKIDVSSKPGRTAFNIQFQKMK